MGITKGTFEQSGVFARIFILLAITLFFTLVLSPIIATISFSNPTDIGLMKLSQLLLSIGVIVIPPFVLAYYVSANPLNFLHLDVEKINWVDIMLVVAFMIIIIPFINLLGDLNHQLVLPKVFSGIETWMKTSEDQAAQITEKFLNVHTIQGLLFNVFLIAIIPAIGEELYFRGALQGIVQSWKGVKVSIWITAILFSTIHMQFYGFVPRMLMGAFFGYLLFWSNNMWLPITAHFINNFIAIIFYYLKLNGFKMPDIDAIGTGNTLWIGIASGAIGIFCIFRLKRRFQQRKEKITNS
jgi:membrane protease YdiL (CAAX protease family)